ncbi:SIR2 family protein [Caballeronia sp. LZ008]|uniref:SIR2 family protein n=1 Tax=unclassified Caballeronia TaxID=2646786 RepID=UPI002027A62E|nr:MULTISPECIES: SIR2 family protein [unclassified Caballeronia]MDR5796503.1 SIR2 family protein [Caballeronia sp. LZ008]
MDYNKLVTTLAQECVKELPLIVLGSGASAAHKIPGMGRLGDHLVASSPPENAGAQDLDGWKSFCEKVKVTDLESALTEVQLSSAMTNHVVTTTWNYLNPFDLEIFDQVVANRQLLPLSRLFRHLLDSTVSTIHVVTPNYDRLGEYAAEAAGFAAYTGFSYGFIGRRTERAPSIKHGKVEGRTVSIWKVHGSFGWFVDEDGVVTGLPPRRSCPAKLRPVIITPGIEKYRLTHEEPFLSIKANADKAIRSANAFLCVGFGFNDSHLQPLLVERCQTKGVPLVLLTQTITEKARDLFKRGRFARYMALEQCSEGTRMYCNDTPDGVVLEGVEYWQLDNFLNLVM